MKPDMKQREGPTLEGLDCIHFAFHLYELNPHR